MSKLDVVHPMKLSHVVVLSSAPYESPLVLSGKEAPSTLRNVNLLVKQGLLEPDPMFPKTVVRCTPEGTDVVRRYKEAGWI